MKTISAWTCETCGKRCFFSKAAARTEAKVVDRNCRPYRCPQDRSLWHYGHLPKAVLSGDIDRRRLWKMRGKTS